MVHILVIILLQLLLLALGFHHKEPFIIDPGQKIPEYTVDLSQPPRQRWQEIARLYCDRIAVLNPVFELLISSKSTKFLTAEIKDYLNNNKDELDIFDAEQREEIMGIREVLGRRIEPHVLFSLNLLIDQLVLCTSGGAIATDSGQKKMAHFRTVDWYDEMEDLRDLLIQVDFVQGSGGPVIARAITFAGFVGILTGVRYVDHSLSYAYDLLTIS
jgi:N-acylethanolamine-hydrolysing acid amidase beta subunit-like protein